MNHAVSSRQHQIFCKKYNDSNIKEKTLCFLKKSNKKKEHKQILDDINAIMKNKWEISWQQEVICSAL